MKHIKAALFALFAAVLSGGVFAFAIAEEAAVSVSGDVAAVNTEEAEKPLDLSRALEIEKAFVLETVTGLEGGDTGRHPIFEHIFPKRVFYVSDELCTGDNCRAHRAIALKRAKKFAKDYNQVIGREVIVINEEIDKFSSLTKEQTANGRLKDKYLSYIAIHLRESSRVGRSRGRASWDCLDKKGKWISSNHGIYARICRILISTRNSPGFSGNIAHEMINVMGINDTLDTKFSDCLVFDRPSAWGARVYKKRAGGMCDIEMRLVRFYDRHLKAGMTKADVSAIFDEHWKTSDFTIALAKKYQPRKAGKKQFQAGGNR